MSPAPGLVKCRGASHADHHGDATHACPSAADDQAPTGTQTALDLELNPDDHDAADRRDRTESSPTPALADVAPTVRPLWLPWAALLRRTLGVQGDRFPKCHSQMVLLALITHCPL